MTKPLARRRAGLLACVGVAAASASAPAWAQDDVSAQLKALKATIDAQARELEAQHEALETQAAEISALKAATPADEKVLESFSGRGADPQAGQDPSSPPASGQSAQGQSTQGQSTQGQSSQGQPSQGQSGDQSAPAPSPGQAGSAPAQPVGEAPPPPSTHAAVAAVTPSLPDNLGVLTRPGHVIVEPQIEYLHASTNELVFRGVQIVPGLQVGLIDASTAERNTFSGAYDMRIGVTNRSEIEIRVPYVWRHDVVQTLSQQSQEVTETQTLSNADIGDVEVTGRYQLNSSRNGAAVWIAALDVKTNTGLGPYDVPYDQYGVAQKLSTGSGFWALEPTISVLYPTDPVVLFASVGYIYNFAANVNREITSDIDVGRVVPGGSPLFALGFAFALNDRFSYSLGFKEEFVLETATEVNKTWQYSTDLNVGLLTLGLSFRLTPTLTISDNFEFGVTHDAPDVHLLTRFTFTF